MCTRHTPCQLDSAAFGSCQVSIHSQTLKHLLCRLYKNLHSWLRCSGWHVLATTDQLLIGHALVHQAVVDYLHHLPVDLLGHVLLSAESLAFGIPTTDHKCMVCRAKQQGYGRRMSCMAGTQSNLSSAGLHQEQTVS